MILSASVNADVPARYGAWFQRRLDAGFLRVAGSDPWKQRKIWLDREHVEGIVFWTRDVVPFMPVLDALARRAIAFVVHYALAADPATPGADAAIAAIRALRARYGGRAVVWRYDPLVLDERSPAQMHLRRLTALGRNLVGVVDEVVIAFERSGVRAKKLAAGVDANSRIADDDAARTATSVARRDLVRQLAEIAATFAMRLSVCSDANALAPGSSPARCIDARRLAEIAGRAIEAPTAGFMRDCLCARAIDIGDYGGTEPVCFCGARPKRVRLRHDPQSDFLFEPVDRFKTARSGDLPF